MFWGTAYSVSDLILDYICDIIYNFYLFQTEQLYTLGIKNLSCTNIRFAFSPLFNGSEKVGDGEKRPRRGARHCTRNRLICFTIILVMLLLYGVGLAIGLIVGLSQRDDSSTEKEKGDRKIPVGAVVSDHGACSDIGRFVLFS